MIRRAHGIPAAAFPAALLAAGLLVTTAAPAAAQEFMEAYRAGLEAIEREDWVAAERLLETAAAERPEAAERLIRFLHFKPYAPHLYLGVARFHQGDCPGALEAWSESERQGIGPSIEEAWSTVAEGRAECRRRREAAEEARRSRTELEQLLARAGRAAEEAAALAPEAERAGIWRRGDPSPAERLESARSDLASARSRLRGTEGAAPDPEALDRADELARRALATLERLQTDLSSQREAIRTQQGSARQRVDSLSATARRLLDTTAELASEVPPVAEQREALRQVLQTAEAGLETASLDELERRRNRLAAAIERLRQTAEPPPAELLAAADAYFAGEIERALDLLDRPSLRESPDPRTRAHAALLRAAARFSLWQAEGAGDIDLLEAAKEDVRTARQADPGIEPLPRAFSPRFIAFFEANEQPEEPGGSPEASGS